MVQDTLSRKKDEMQVVIKKDGRKKSAEPARGVDWKHCCQIDPSDCLLETINHADDDLLPNITLHKK